MTVSSTTNRKSFTGDGVTTSFGTSPVVFFNSSELAVQVITTATGAATTLTENTNYTVSGGSGSTGTVNLAGGTSPNGAPTASQTLLIRRVLPLTQTDDFVNNDINDAEVTEDRFDKTVMQIQQLDEELGRGLVIPPAETATDALTVLPFDRASQYLAFDASKNPIASPGPAGDNVPVSTFMATVLDDTTAADARTTLGAAGSGAVTTSGLTMATVRLLGRTTAGTGAVEEISVGAALTLSGGSLSGTAVPSGAMFDFAGTSVPSGYLGCDGSNVSRTTYAALFAAIGTTWGVGDGSTTFTLPDFRRRVAVGSGGSGTGTLGNAVGNTGGAETHTLTAAEMPTSVILNNAGGLVGASGGSFGVGSGSAHNNMQPSAVVLKIIKT